MKKMWRILVEVIYAVRNLFVWKTCTVCGRELLLFEKHLCTECLAEMPLSYSFGHKAHTQYNENEMPAEEFAEVEGVYSLMLYKGDYKKCLYALKYQNNTAIGLWLGEKLGETLEPRFDYIIPVPLHWRKRLKRGYNQSLIIARGILKALEHKALQNSHGSSTLNVPEEQASNMQAQLPPICTNILKRRHYTPSQTHKNRASRAQNVENAFFVNAKSLRRLQNKLCQRDLTAPHPPQHLQQQSCLCSRPERSCCPPPPHILIVDDVLTTGATLNACAKALQAKCNCKVSFGVIAYVE